MRIVPLEPLVLPKVVAFTDRWIGEGYFSLAELEDCLARSQKNGLNCSLCALEDEEIVGIRLTLAPGRWADSKSGKIAPETWGLPQDQVGYFQSLFVHGDHQQKGIGKQLSRQSIEILRQMGAQGVLCHSWLESPGNSSQLYLQRMGFKGVKSYPRFWYDVDYHCTRCGPERCVCTAMEMLLKWEGP